MMVVAVTTVLHSVMRTKQTCMHISLKLKIYWKEI